MTNNKFTIIITGASKGVGAAIAKELASEGYNLVLISRHQKFVDEGNLLSIPADITNESDIKNAVNKSILKFGRVDVLINNAGIFLDKPLDKTSTSEFEKIISTNIKGAFILSREVIPNMKKNKKGLIINIGSKISHNTNVSPNKVLYATSKYAIEGFSYALGKELKPYGIRVTCLMPGTIATFKSFKANDFMKPSRIGEIVSLIIKLSDIEFESIVFKSVKQNI